MQVILLTGFLGRPNTFHTQLKCPTKRLKASVDSVIALSKQLPNRKIFVAITGDNNSYQEFKSLLSGNLCHSGIEFSFFKQDSADEPFGKGRCEYKLITKAISRFKLFRYSQIVKVTIKYSIRYHAMAFKTLRKHEGKAVFGWKYYCDDAIDTRFYSFKSNIFSKYEHEFLRVDDEKGYYLEHALFKVSKLEGSRPCLFQGRPIIEGLSGSENVFIKDAMWKKLLKIILRFLPF